MRCLVLAVALFSAGLASAEEACVPGDGAVLDRVCYTNDTPNPLYGHGVLGDTPEWSAVRLYWGPKVPAGLGRAGASTDLKLDTGIFEDIAPRLVEADGDPFPEVLVVESQPGKGARAVILDLAEDGLRGAPGPFIGTQNRWLAPLGMADLDGDGVQELAYIDRPHLAKTLRVFQFKGGRLTQVAETDDLTNHRIGQDFISGGIRNCADGPEMIVATGNWQAVVAVRYFSGVLIQQVLGPHKGPESFAAAMACDPLPR